MKDLQQTAQNLNRLTDENSELTLALSQFKTFGSTSWSTSHRARQARSRIPGQHRKDQHQSYGERQHPSHPAKPAELVGETKGRQLPSSSRPAKHQAIQRDN